MGFSPGRHFQEILKRVEDAQLGGELSNRGQAMEWVEKELRQRGQEMKRAKAYQLVGRPEARLDGEEKVTGRAIYTVDVELPGMAHGKVLRSPYPHARLARVDGSKAEKLPGVYAVITRDDQRRLGMFGAAYKDQTIVAVDKVRYVGDPVAAVAALDDATAEAALNLIDVEYEELPAVTSIEEALAPGAPLVHEGVSSGGELMGQHYETPKEFSGTNLCYRFSYAKGNIEAGFAEADYIFEDTFSFPRVQHFSMEPHATVAHVDGDRITLWAATQEPFTLREHLGEIFRVPLNKVRIIVPYVGGAYGGKLAVKTEPLAVALAFKAKRPVRLAHTIEESFKTVTRHPARVQIKSGVTKDGKLVARQCLIHMETGAYADAGPRVTQKAGYRCFGPYRIPHVKTDAYTVYTNTCSRAARYRGFGTLQVTWAYESQMDIIAEKLALDPLEVRLKNLLKKGELYTPGDTPVDCDLKEGLLRRSQRDWLEQERHQAQSRQRVGVLHEGRGRHLQSRLRGRQDEFRRQHHSIDRYGRDWPGSPYGLEPDCRRRVGCPIKPHHGGPARYRRHALRCQYQRQQFHRGDGAVCPESRARFEASTNAPWGESAQDAGRGIKSQARTNRRRQGRKHFL